MELKQFIKETLVEISQGVNEAHEELKGSGTVINPSYVKNESEKVFLYTEGLVKHPLIQFIDFDVAVTASEESGNTGKAGVSIVGINLGTQRTKDASTSGVSRIKFQVPILLKQNKMET